MRFSAGCVGQTRAIYIPGSLSVANQRLGGRVAYQRGECIDTTALHYYTTSYTCHIDYHT